MTITVPTTTYEVPEFLLSPDDIYRAGYPGATAIRHARRLSMQSYALNILHMFEDISELTGLNVAMEEDGFVVFGSIECNEATPALEDFEETLAGWRESINGARNDFILEFIRDICSGIHWNRTTIAADIGGAYDVRIGREDMPWETLMGKRQALLDAHDLDQAVPIPSHVSARPRV